MYLLARCWGIQPGEFWDMTVSEWFAEYDLRVTNAPGDKFAGKLTRGDVDELLDFAKNGRKKNGPS